MSLSQTESGSAVGNHPFVTLPPRKYCVGAELQPGGGVHFRVWAPNAATLCVVDDTSDPPQKIALQREDDGYFAGLAPYARAGMRYRFELNGDHESLFPDPASRCQPDGPHGSSQVIDPAAFLWTDTDWTGVSLKGQILYELHPGTFTSEGSWAAAKAQLPELASVGITVIEIMPVADFPGRFGWGYDGVGLFAPTWLYGTPDQFREFVNEAHRLHIGVILDVVYNHFGPDGNFLSAFASDYFSAIETDWGQAINFDGHNSGPVRDFFVANARYWMEEYHLDGLRLDATQDIHDSSQPHIISEIASAARQAAANRSIILIAENEPQNIDLVRPAADGGIGLDALWNDDFHHSVIVALTGRNEAYYSDYFGAPQEFVSAVKNGFLYQGQWYSWQQQRRGKPAIGLQPASFVTFIQNHDQVANTARGERPNLLATAGKYKAMTALLLLAPGTPMLFQGQEFGATTPFLYFCDHRADLSKRVREGRSTFLAQFRSLALPEMQHVFGDPGNPSTFEKSKLDFSERQKNHAIYALHKDLIRLRKDDPVFASQSGRLDGAVIGPSSFVLRYFGAANGDRLLLINLSRDQHLKPAPEPLLAPPLGCQWNVVWSSEDPKYGGYGTYPPDTQDCWRLPGYSAIVLSSLGAYTP